MSNEQDEFLQELLADFRIEATEHYNTIQEGLLSLESRGSAVPDSSTIERIFRCTHSLKGAARAVNLLDIEKLCMTLESVFNSLKKGESILNPPLFDVLNKAVDVLNLLISNIKKDGSYETVSSLPHVIRNLEFAQKGSANVQKEEESISSDSADIQNAKIETEDNIYIKRDPSEKDDDTIRISSGKLNLLLRETEDFIVVKSAVEFYKNELAEISAKYNDDKLTYVFEDIIRFQKIVDRMVDDLIIGIKSTLLSPFSTILNIVPKIARDIAKASSKDISVSIKDDYYEIDRRILEEIKDPVIHLVRNCVDHGIETTEERIKKGKPAQGKLIITVKKEASRQISLIIDDDGDGINTEKVLKSAIKHNIIDEARASKLTENEIFSLIFKSGVSSNDMITNISGRGLGMAIVAEKVANLGGTIDIKSCRGCGTTFTITLPQSIATFRGILIIVEGRSFIIPSIFLEKALLVKSQYIKSIGGRNVIIIDGNAVGYLPMREALGIEKQSSEPSKNNHLNVLILSVNNNRIAFSVDEVKEEQEGIVKDLGPVLNQIKKIAGVTILANGVIVPVINVSELINEISFNSQLDYFDENETDIVEQSRKKILVVEDSITIRTMLKTMIENGGYIVKTAVDGQDGYETLMKEEFDMLVSDVEMPRMNGFELTSMVRQNGAFTDMPIVLVTGRDKPEDRKKGMEAGANAYIIKGSFEKSNLLDSIQRLI